jgi:hypothetical protein
MQLWFPDMNTTFLKHFDCIKDPRIERCKRYNLLDTFYFLSLRNDIL